ncbi:MAG: PIN domain-containing protein [Spirulinaceae cyanobacterium]
MLDQILRLRQEYSLKLPDAIIVSTAIHVQAALVTGDRKLLNIPDLNPLTF